MSLSLSSFSIDKEKIIFGAKLLLIKTLYVWSSFIMLPDMWLAYDFGKDLSFDNIWIEILFFIIILIPFLKSYNENSGISICSTFLFIMSYIPMNSRLTICNDPIELYLVINLFYSFLFFWLSFFANKEKKNNYIIINSQQGIDLWLKSNKKRVYIARAFFVLITIGILIKAYLYNGLDILSVFQQDMYSVRGDYFEYSKELEGSLWSYLSMIIIRAGDWIFPIYLFFALRTKNILDITLSIIAILASFSLDMQKGNLFIIGVVLFAHVISNKKKCKVCKKIIDFFIVLFFAVILMKYLYDNNFLYELLIKRLFYMPTYLMKSYYDFFSINPKLWFTQDAFIIEKIASVLIGRNYNLTVARLISIKCFRGGVASPNNGLFSEAYSQVGYFGVFLFPVIYAWLITVLNKYSKSYGLGVVIIVMYKFSSRLINVPILMSTYMVGLIIFIIITRAIYKMSSKNDLEGEVK